MSLRCGWAGRAAVLVAAIEAALVLSVGAFALGGSPAVTAPYASVTPSIDGKKGAGEWSNAARLAMPFFGNPGTLYVEHDASYLYVLLVVADSTVDPASPPEALVFF